MASRLQRNSLTGVMVTSDALRERLPQLSDAAFITDGGMETTLYQESIDGNPVDLARRSAELRQAPDCQP